MHRQRRQLRYSVLTAIGLVQQVAGSVKASLDFMPDNTNIGVIAYNCRVQFFASANEGSMAVCMANVVDPFVPLPKSRILLNVRKHRAQIEDILDKIGSVDKELNRAQLNDSCAGAALKAAIDLLKDGCGRVLWFFMDVPSVGYGALRSRNNRSLYNTDKEKTLLMPGEVSGAYTDMAKTALNSGVGIDLFVCAQGDVDLASIVPTASLTGGEVCCYFPFNSPEHGDKLHFDLFRSLTRQTVYDVSLIARCSIGLSIDKYYGSFGEMLEGPVKLSVMDADKTVAFTLKQNSKLNADSAHIQFAVLYTTGDNERMVRVFNYTLFMTNAVSIVYGSVDMDAVMGLEARIHASDVRKLSVSRARDELCKTCVKTLSYYRKTVSEDSRLTQFVLPETMKFYPLLLLSLMKTPAYARMDNTRLDAKVANLIQLSELSFSYFLMRLYPKVYSVKHIIDPAHSDGRFIVNAENGTESNTVHKPENLPCSINSMASDDAYIIANSDFIYLYLTMDVAENVLEEVFGKRSVSELVLEKGIPALGTEGNQKVRNVIENLRKERAGAYQQVKILLSTSVQTGMLLKELLVEDGRNPQNEFSYIQFLPHLHNAIFKHL